MNPYAGMTPEGFSKFGGGGDTLVTPSALAIVLLAILLVFVLRRKYVIAPLLTVWILIPLTQVVVVFGLHFMMLRIMVLAGWIRLLAGRIGGDREFRMSRVDRAVLWFGLSSAVAFVILWGGEVGAIINRLGMLYNIFGIYFLLRWLIRDRQDMERTAKVLVVICVVLAGFMMNERQTGRNWFSIFGLAQLSEVRGGHARAQGCFAHAILAGTFGATLAPMFLALWRESRAKLFSMIGLISALLMTYASGSSTPAITFASGIGAYCLWSFRTRLRILRWAVVIGTVMLQLVMNHPVWFLLSYFGKLGGSSGYHRYQLIDQAVNHFGEWWFVGTRDTSHWGWNMWDTSNFYVEIAATGGLITLALFIFILVRGFQAVGSSITIGNRGDAGWIWAAGCALFAHAMAFTGVSYFDQTIVGWYLALAMVVAGYQTAKKAAHPVEIRPAVEKDLQPEAIAAEGW